jgi:alginate O-acetyltransferase complex protein AlgI
MSLTAWFRQYIYFPLGGNRKGQLRTYLNILIVFIVSGLWHGTGMNFLVWGIWYGLFMALEKWSDNHQLVLPSVPNILRWIYAMMVVMFGWVLFRSASLEQALYYAKSLLHFGSGTGTIYWQSYFSPYVIMATVAGAILALGLFRRLHVPSPLRFIGLSILLGLSLLAVGGNTYTSFIYFHF